MNTEGFLKDPRTRSPGLNHSYGSASENQCVDTPRTENALAEEMLEDHQSVLTKRETTNHMQHDVISVQAQGTPLEENCSEKCSTGVAPPDSFSRSTSATGANVPNENRVLRIVPRTKTVQSRRVQRTVNAVEVTADTIRGLSSVSETEAAASLVCFHFPLQLPFQEGFLTNIASLSCLTERFLAEVF